MNLQNKLREQMAQTFVEALQKDQLPWKACWQVSLPENATNGKRYRGINSLMLSYVAAQAGYSDPRWCTFKQASEKGWQVKKGSKATPVEYWAYFDRERRKLLSWQEAKKLLRENPDSANDNLVLRSRVYSVFNGNQIDGIPPMEAARNISPESIREQRDTLFHNMGLNLQEGDTQPYYVPETDTVHLPYEKDFFDNYSYACTFLHECGHATGHESRLNRDLSSGYATEGYAKEELRAEIASAFAAQAMGLQLSDQQLESHVSLHTAYIQSWAKEIQSAPEELFRAIKDAEKIADYLIEKGEFERLQDRSQAPELEYAGRLEYLASNGTVVEYEDFKTQSELVQAVKHESDIGAPFALILYEDKNGCTVSTEFLHDLSTPPCAIRYREGSNRSIDTAKILSAKEQIACAKMIRPGSNKPRNHKPRALER